MPAPILPPAEMAQLAAMAANPEILGHLSESEAGLLEHILKNGVEVYQNSMLFSAFPEEGKYARRHYPKHMAFMAAGKHAKERGFVAANRTGKTFATTYESACHVTGYYQPWWEGRVFAEPVDWIVSGLTNETTKDPLVKYMLGNVKQSIKGRNYVDGTGMIPASQFVPGSLVFRGGAGRIVAEIQVYYKDSKSEFSTLYVKSNEQGVGGFSGSSRHGVLLDEEHDEEVASECLTRTATTNGLLITSFTPLSGITPTVMRYLPEFREMAHLEERVWDPLTGTYDDMTEYASIREAVVERAADGYGQWITESMYTMRVGWKDNPPHLTKKEMDDQIRGTPRHLLDAKTKGIPVLGEGRVYPVEFDRMVVRPFRIPDHWPRAYAMDVGWNFTAVLWGAYDMDSDTWFIYREYREGQAPPLVHARAIMARDEWIPGVIDPSAAGSNIRDGEGVIEEYRAHGLHLTPADNSLSAGIDRCYDLMTTGRLRFWPTLPVFESEFALYRYQKKPKSVNTPGYGKPVKQNDHLMDCFDAETEVLTDEGWRFFGGLQGSERLATVNLETDALEYQEQSAPITAREHDGPMVAFGGHKLNALVTPNHRMVIYPRSISRQADVPQIKRAEDLTIWDRIKLHSDGWCGKPRDTVEVGIAHGRTATMDAMDFAQLLGWYVAEGSKESTIQIPGRGYGVCLSQLVGGPHYDALRELLGRTPWKWHYNSGSLRTSCRWLHEYVSPLGDFAWEKRVPQWVRESEPAIIEAFLEGAIAGDGWVQRGQRNYATTSRLLADDMQELFLKVGKSASVRHVPAKGRGGGLIRGRRVRSVHDQWWVHEWTLPVGYLRDSENRPNFSLVPYRGMVYCVTVPNGTLVVRRHGKPMVAGNCMRYLMMSGPQVMKTRREAVMERSGALGGWMGATAGLSVGDRIAGY